MRMFCVRGHLQQTLGERKINSAFLMAWHEPPVHLHTHDVVSGTYYLQYLVRSKWEEDITLGFPI